MSEKSKYYTPSIEEFYVGFEYEILSNEGFQEDDGDWNSFSFGTESDVYDFGMSDWPEALKYHIDEKQVRVKYLDRQDIEELGWKMIKGREYQMFSNPKYAEWRLRIYTDVTISIRFYHPDDSKGELHFHGTIKNKSELKRLMQQLGI